MDFPEFKLNVNGVPFMTGCLERVSQCGALAGVPQWNGQSEACPILRRELWATQAHHREYEWSDNDQGNTPSCTLASLANHGEFFLARMGRAKTNLDWLKAWRTLSGGYGGVALDTALRYAMTEGFPLSDGSGALIVDEVWDLPRIDAVFSAVMRGVPVWFGASQHAECGMTVVKNGGFKLDVRGTWGRGYGDQGWYGRSESYIARGLPLYGAFAIRTWKLRSIDL